MDLNYIDVLRDVGAHFSVNRMLTAECYKQRMEKGLSFLEFNYMIMQSYDFYTLYQKYGCNMEFGGDDQWSNMLGGTELIRRKLGKDAYAMTINLPHFSNTGRSQMEKSCSDQAIRHRTVFCPFSYLRDGVIDIMGLLVSAGLCASRSEARRAVEQGGVTVNGEKVTDIKTTYTPDDIKNAEEFVLKRGKKKFCKIVMK